MVKRIARFLIGDTKAPFEGYYGRLLARGDSESVPTMREARRDYEEILKSRYGHPLI